jgi:hypothetical protein
MTTPGGLPAIAISLCYCSPLETGERLVEPIRRFGAPLVDLIRPRSYLKMIAQADAGAPAGRHYYEKASTLSGLGDEAIEALVEYATTCPSPHSQILIQHVHGAASRIGPTETAFALRGESYVICMLAAWDDSEAVRHIAWSRACWKALEPYATSGVYVNFLGEVREGRVRAAYGVNYERLVALKNTYDPTNFFALNQNIRPTMKEEEHVSNSERRSYPTGPESLAARHAALPRRRGVPPRSQDLEWHDRPAARPHRPLC